MGSHQEALAKRTRDLGLSARSGNCLRKAGIEYVYQLVNWTEREMLEMKNFGHGSLLEIKEALEGLDLSLGMDVASPIELAAVRLKPCVEVVETLEEALAMARAGLMRSVVLAYEKPGRVTGTAFAIGDGDRAHIVYAMECVKLRLLTEGVDV